MTNTIRREIYKFIIVKNFTALSFSFMISIYVLFLLSRGLNLFQISILGFVFSWVMLVLQIPTGALADVWGRKKTYILSKFFLLLSFISYIVSKEFSGYLVAEILWAVANALESGCVSAHIWETITDKCRVEGLSKSDTEKINKKASSWISFSTNIVSAAAGLIGAYLAQINMIYPWIVCSVFVSLSIVVDVLLIQKDTPKKISWKYDLNNMYKTSVKAFNIAVSSKRLKEILLIGFFARLSLTTVYNFWQAKGRNLNGADIAIFGIVWALIEASCSVGSILGERLNRKINEKSLLVGSISLISVLIFLLAMTKSFVYLIAVFLVLEVTVIIREYAFEISEQKAIDKIIESNGSTLRATLLSVISMISQLGISFGLLVGGKLAKDYSIDFVWYISAGISLGLSLVLLKKLVDSKKDQRSIVQV